MEHELEHVCLYSPPVRSFSTEGVSLFLPLQVSIALAVVLLVNQNCIFWETFCILLLVVVVVEGWFSLMQIFTLLLFYRSYCLEASCVIVHFAFFPEFNTWIILCVMRNYSELIALHSVIPRSLVFKFSSFQHLYAKRNEDRATRLCIWYEILILFPFPRSEFLLQLK